MVSRLFIYNWNVICLLINWYQDFCLSIGIVSLLNWYQYALHWHILIGIIFELTPYWHCFCFRQKGEEHFVLFSFISLLVLCFEQKGEKNMFLFVLSLTPLLMIDKKGEKNLSLYAFYLVCMFYVVFIKFIWYQSII